MKLRYLPFILGFVLMANSCVDTKKKEKDRIVRFEHYSYNGVFKRMFNSTMQNMARSTKYVAFLAVDVDNKQEKEICCETWRLNNNNTFKNSYLSINDIRDTSLISVMMTNEQYKRIGADKYDTYVLADLIRKYPHSKIDSLYQYGGFLINIFKNVPDYDYPYLEHLLFVNRIDVFQDCESGYMRMGRKY